MASRRNCSSCIRTLLPQARDLVSNRQVNTAQFTCRMLVVHELVPHCDGARRDPFLISHCWSAVSIMLWIRSQSTPGGHVAQTSQDFMQPPWHPCDLSCSNIAPFFTRESCLSRCRSQCQFPAQQPEAQELAAEECAMHSNVHLQERHGATRPQPPHSSAFRTTSPSMPPPWTLASWMARRSPPRPHHTHTHTRAHTHTLLRGNIPSALLLRARVAACIKELPDY